jgi:hypothetical protein
LGKMKRKERGGKKAGRKGKKEKSEEG